MSVPNYKGFGFEARGSFIFPHISLREKEHAFRLYRNHPSLQQELEVLTKTLPLDFSIYLLLGRESK